MTYHNYQYKGEDYIALLGDGGGIIVSTENESAIEIGIQGGEFATTEVILSCMFDAADRSGWKDCEVWFDVPAENAEQN